MNDASRKLHLLPESQPLTSRRLPLKLLALFLVVAVSCLLSVFPFKRPVVLFSGPASVPVSTVSTDGLIVNAAPAMEAAKCGREVPGLEARTPDTDQPDPGGATARRLILAGVRTVASLPLLAGRHAALGLALGYRLRAPPATNLA